jgi:hypothetical protein
VNYFETAKQLFNGKPKATAFQSGNHLKAVAGGSPVKK